MDVVGVLRNEHKIIESELSELDAIIETVTNPESSRQIHSGARGKHEINYSDLVYSFWRVCALWERHEKMEEKIFEVIKREGGNIPIRSILLEHQNLKEMIKIIESAINSGNDSKVRRVLTKEMRAFIGVIREHSKDEEVILDGIDSSLFSENEMSEIRKIILKAQG